MAMLPKTENAKSNNQGEQQFALVFMFDNVCFVMFFLNQVPWLLVSRLFDIVLCFAGGHSVVS